MSVPDAVPKSPRGSSLEKTIAGVHSVYSRVEGDQRGFLESAASRRSPLACPPGCGSCCEAFVPDILPAEAAFMAAWLLEREPLLAAQAASWTKGILPSAPPCPFMRPGNDGGHCAVYQARPLVCRLFAAAGTRDKEGRTSFRPCAHMPLAGYPAVGSGRPTLAGEELARAFGAEPPVMADYSAALSALSPSEAGSRSLLLEALPAAIARVALALSLAELSPDQPYFEPHERPNEPIALRAEPEFGG
jgi:uncharacterized protein